MKKKQRTSAKRVALIFLCFVLAVILIIMLGGTIYIQYLLGKVNYIDPGSGALLSQDELNNYLSSIGDGGSGSGSADSDSDDVTFDNHTTQIGGKGSDLVNILLIGQDRQPGQDRGRSDSMILCTFNKKAKTLVMTSFMRDLYLEIPGYEDNRINVAYAAGGMQLLDQTIEENFGVHIDGNVEVDFNQFSQIIDLLGGVTIELREDEAQVVNEGTGSNLSGGTQLLNGAQALAYARIRSLDNDFGRTSRQRTVMNALLEAYMDTNLFTILSLLDDILPLVTTDMSEFKLMCYAVDLFPMLSNATIISQRVPADDTYENRNIRDMAVLVADMDANRQMLEQTLLGTGG